MTRFYLGTHEPSWLARLDRPLFVSRRRLVRREVKVYPRAIGPWALDSGGFTELSMFGCWSIGPMQYTTEVRRFAAEIGRLEWAAPQDWMCESFMLAKTGLSVVEHQRRTVCNLLDLRALAPDLPFIPVLQGDQPADYLRHADAYEQAGIDLTAEPIVGVGSVCRRSHTTEIVSVLRELAGAGLRLHGFGVKKLGLAAAAPYLASADSLAWSQHARRQRKPIMTGCTHAACNNCIRYACRYADEIETILNKGAARDHDDR